MTVGHAEETEAWARRASDIDRMLSGLVAPALARLAAELRSVSGLAAAEQAAVQAAAVESLREATWRRVSRVLVLELNAARLAGRLAAPEASERWAEWVRTVERPGFWESMAEHYPALPPRIHTVIENRCAAAYRFAVRFARDRGGLAPLTGAEPGQLLGVSFGAGDSHRGGQSVSTLRCEGGRLLYKPRSVAVDAVLGRALPRLLSGSGTRTGIRVPQVCQREDLAGEYGWCAYVAHRYCVDDAELRTFYRNLGHWLAVMRLLGGSDLHSENLIAAGPVPVVVDCETLFTPHVPNRFAGYGDAVELAADLLENSVMRTGLLPGRGGQLGLRGVDPSAAGALPGQQPPVSVPVIVDEGTDRARVGSADLPPPPTVNHPSPEPELARHWPQVAEGFAELTEALRRLDRAGELAPLLADFADCPIRVVLRDTVVYTELGRMLWHPSSLHRPQRACARAVDLLSRHGAARAQAATDPAVIDAEIAELCDGDVPVFTTTPGSGVLSGPRGTGAGAAVDLVSDALRRWREVDPVTDRNVVQAALVGAYLNEGWLPPPQRLPLSQRSERDLERRRRQRAAAIMQDLVASAVHGPDGTVTWVAPVLSPHGWVVQPLPADLYNGLAGVAVLVAAYQREVAAGRAAPVPGADALLPATLRTLRAFDEAQAAGLADAQSAGIEVRPDPPGGYLGLGSRIWGWLLLERLGAIPASEALARSEALAARVPAAVAADADHDLLVGAAGAVVPLLRLAQRSGEHRWRAAAVEIGARLAELARPATGAGRAGVYWSGTMFPAGVGGLSHGCTGISWALARLALAGCGAEPAGGGAEPAGGDADLAGGDADLARGEADPAGGEADLVVVAEAGFAYEESLYDPNLPGWQDLRTPEPHAAATWCHGAVGIGICAADLRRADPAGGDRWREVLGRAAAVAWPAGVGWNHTLCHGDLGAWELFSAAWLAGVAPPGATREALLGQILSSLEEHGAVSGMARDVFTPGLLAGQGGVAYQLLRMHPDSDLPSVLLPDPAT